MNKKVLLMILDGWGIAKDPKVSAIDAAYTPFYDNCLTTYSHSKLQASGGFVGLPDGQMGNSEVGHMNIGAGRIVFQNLVKINNSFKDDSIAQNSELLKAIDYAKQNKKAIHCIGLVSDGGVHAHINHLKGLCTIAHQHQIKNLFIHAFTDGRDCDPKSGLGFLKDLEQHCENTTGKIASIVGRYYAMDRDNRWERVKIAYDLLANGIGKNANSTQEAIQSSYNEGITDEFIKPIVIHPKALIKEGDVVINFNFRTDRGREITKVLTQEDFPEFGMKKMNLYYVTFTNYDESFQNIKILFEDTNLANTLGEILEKNNRKQIRIAETEKYPHVTFFFSGGREEPFKNEKRLLCPSPKVATYDLKPEMSAAEIRDAVIPELNAKSADFICLNFANADMVGHTGSFEAAKFACETVDLCAKHVCAAALGKDYTVIIIADHGNSDMMINPDGTPNTAHTTNLVPCLLLDNKFQPKLKDGKLGDLAPTILKLMGIDVPKQMTGECLF